MPRYPRCDCGYAVARPSRQNWHGDFCTANLLSVGDGRIGELATVEHIAARLDDRSYGCQSVESAPDPLDALQARLPGRVEQVHPQAMVCAQDVARLAAPRLAAGEGVPPELALPVYLRDQVVRAPG